MKKNLYTKKDIINRSVRESASQWYQLVCFLFFFIALSQTARGQISGVVYRDFNEDGVRSYVATALGEIGVSGVTVNVYTSAGLAGSTTTSSATANVGSYTVTVSGAGPYRVEFVNLPTGYFDGLHGISSGTSVQFVASSPATNVNLGINYPTDYCQALPDFIVPCYVNGDPTGGGTSGTQPVLVTLPYGSTGDAPAETAIATNVQTGTVYGVAYQRTSKVVFSSAFVKRHSGLGPNGAGAIYITRPGSAISVLFTTLPTATTAVALSATTGGGTTVISTAVGSNTIRGLPAATTTQNHDPVTFDQVGKAGLGDIELSEDGTQLYAVNLGDRRLYQIPITNPTSLSPSAGTPTSFTLPAVTQATGSVLRPFGLKVYRGRVYIGAVTTNEAVSTTVNSGTGSTGGTVAMITRDPSTMVAYVFEFNPVNSSFTTVLSFPLSYTKGASDNDQTGVSRADRWYPWTDVQAATGQIPNRYARNAGNNYSYPQPILSGIEFDVDGAMILSIRDRFGDQYGNNNWGTDVSDNSSIYRAIAPGDILRAGQCTAGVNLWTLESNARICSGTATLGANTNQGPGGGEYYYSDAIANGDSPGGVFRPYHAEMSEGGLALLPGRDEVASIVLDPTTNIDAGGIRRFKNSDGSGSPSTSVQIYKSGDVATYGKANGLGDLEINCDLPPIQIGNRVFRDVNNNGIQDPGEPGLAGVQVILRGPGSTTIATATTDANGEYYFSSAVGTSTASSIANLTLTTGGSYSLSFPTSVSAFSISTFPNAGTGPNGESIDSDPNAAGLISFTLGTAGQNDFTFDAGYACTPLALSLTSGTICAGQTVSLTATTGFSSYTFSTGLTQVGTTNVASGSVNGTYSVTAVNSFGCTGTASGSITVNALPVVTLTSATICAGQSATLTATTGFTNYTFSSGLTRIGTTNQATGSTAGTYSVTVVNSSGCVGVSSGTGSGTITVNSLPIVTLSSATICAGQTASLSATAGLSSYTFSSGLTQIGTTNVASSTTAGNYSVTAINSVGCSATATGNITVNPVPALTLSSATICAGQTATLTAGVTGFAAYTFSSGLTRIGTTNQATGTTANTYSITAITALGCSATATGSITVNPVPALTLSSATICAGQTATLTAVGTGFATYAFSAGLTQVGLTNQATGTTANTYSVTATTALGCSTTATGSITVNPVPALTLSSATICAGQTATLTAGGTGFATYAFSSGLTQVGATNQATGTTTNTYSMTATTALGCSATATGSITVNPVPALTLSSATICAGQTATLTAGGAGFATYVFSSGLTQVGATNQAIGTTANTYSVTATTALGCSATATGSITVNPVPALTLSSATICAGQTATLTAGGTGFATYTFSSGLTQVGATSQATGTTANTYSVTATTALGCSATATGSITVNPVPALTLSSATICAGQTATLTAGGAGFATYTFSSGLTQVGATSQATGTSANTYSVTATTALGCSATATGSITVNPVPTLTLSSATICAGQTATLTAGGIGFATFAFSSGLTRIGTTNQATGTTANTYSVTAITALGCSTTATGSITVNPLPALTLSSATICAGQTATLTAGGTGFAIYAFSSGLTHIGTTNQATSTTAGTYSVTATTALGCSATATGSITINANPVVALSSATVCAGQTAILSATTGYNTYLFSAGLTQVGNSNVATGTNTGIYSVTAISNVGCIGSATGSITVNPLPVVSLSSATICAAQSATLVATAGYASYQFSAGLTPVPGQSNVATGILGGTYSVTAISTEGCVGTGSSIITVNPLPVVTLSSATVCAGQTASLTATAGYSSYLFSAGLTQLGNSNVAVGTADGIYSVTAISTEGCSASATGTITVNPLPVVSLSSTTVCEGQIAVLSATSGYTSYSFSTGLTQVGSFTSNVATSLIGGTYSVTAVSSDGCSASATGSITVNSLPVVTLSSATVCAGQSATLVATAGVASYNFSAGLTPVPGTPNMAVGSVGRTYSVIATSGEGCVGTGSGSITVNPLPVVTLSSATVCAGQTASLTATAGYGSYVFSNGLIQLGNSNVAVGTVGGTYSVTAISTEGCSATATGSITINANPVVALSSATVCAGQTAILSATTGYDTYLFSAGLTQVGNSNVATGTNTGIYSVTAISNAGCSATATGTITVNPLPVVSLSSATICAAQSATLVATAGYASYQFSAGLTPVPGQANVATGTLGDTYSVTATSAEGCVGTGSGSITVNPLPVVTLSSATVCAGQTASLTATAGYGSYVFSNGLTQLGNSNLAVGTVGGTYSVTAISTEGCSATATGSITINANPVVALSSATVCAGQTAILSATTGYDTYLFSAGLTQVGNSNVATGTNTGTYSVTATSNAGCSATATGTITVNPLPVVSLSSATICAAQSATLVATAGYASYQFSAGLTPVPGQANIATGILSGTYSVTAISTEGCIGTGSGSITVNPLPVVSLSSATVCAGQTASLTATAGYGSYVFSNGLIQLGNSNVAVGITDGIYSVTAISTEGCSASATGTITVNPLPVVTLSSTTICSGQSATLIATSGYTSYSFSTGLIQDGSSNTATGIAAGAYSVTAKTLEGCSATATGSITVNPTPVVTFSSMTICDGQTASLTATSGYDKYIFSAGLTPVSGTPNVATGTVDGTYSVTASSTEGCSVTAIGSITVNPAVVVTLSSATICAGQIGVLTATAGYDTYLFSVGLTQNGTSNVASGTISGNYSVTAISSAGCVGTATGSITVNPTAVVTLSSATICTGQSAALTATPGFTNYVFSAGLTPVPGASNVAIGTVGGTYSVTASSSAGCRGSATGSITVNPQPGALITATNTTICQGQSATLTASGGDFYNWSANEQTASIVVTTSAIYSVTVSTAAGCSDIASTTVTVNPLPVITVNSATVCSGQSATLAVGGCTGGTVLWSTAANTASILVSPSITTTYSATCTLTTGCSSTTSATVTVNEIPSYTAAPQAITATCTGSAANNDARIVLTTLQNTERADLVVGSTYGSGPVYGAPTNLMVTAGTVSFTNLLNPGSSQPYTIRLYNPGGTCYTDVTVILEPSYCNCPDPTCVPLVIQKTKSGRVR